MCRLKKKLSFFKRVIRLAVQYPIYRITLKNQVPLHILDAKSSIELIVNNKISLSRFGDGEFNWIQGSEYKTNFQKNDKQMSKRLYEVLNSDVKNLAIGLPRSLENVDDLRIPAKSFWVDYNLRNKKKVVQLIGSNNYDKVYLDSQLSRFYIDKISDQEAKEVLGLLKKIWEKRNILIVEGSETRFGVGNDFLSNGKSIRRILGPATNAFEVYDKIMQLILNEAQTMEDPLVIIALGPTATILAHDLALNNIQAIDIGHADIEYEWYIRKSKKRIPIEGKYVNETTEKYIGNKLIDSNNNYLAQIVGKI